MGTASSSCYGPAPAQRVHPGLVPVGFSSSRAAETGLICRVAPGHYFSVCKASLGTITRGISDGRRGVPGEQISLHGLYLGERCCRAIAL